VERQRGAHGGRYRVVPAVQRRHPPELERQRAVICRVGRCIARARIEGNLLDVADRIERALRGLVYRNDAAVAEAASDGQRLGVGGRVAGAPELHVVCDRHAHAAAP
jgi:hypothetical protein